MSIETTPTTSGDTSPLSMVDIQNELLLTKLVMPGVFGELVARDRLLEKLGPSARPLNIIHAPAGFGKTTLLCEWLQSQPIEYTWLSLDEEDSDPEIFARYLLASIQRARPTFGGPLLSILSSAQVPSLLSLAPLWIKQLELLQQPLILALDDFHWIDNEIVLEFIAYLLDHRPNSLYLALTSRTEPTALPLPRWRVRRQLAEITETDLRFNTDEVTRFIHHVSKMGLSESDIHILATRTEGWIAGLQLAVLSLENEADRAAFIRAFAGDDRYITDYLTEEVLLRQSEEVRQFLLRTSILKRLCGPLCDQVSGQTQCDQKLRHLEQSNMFLIPLDNKGRWYRYHHLFADLLQTHLKQEGSSTYRTCHRKASDWYLANQFPNEAFHHAIVISDFDAAVAVLDQFGQQLFEEGQCLTLLKWYEQLPYQIIAQDPCRLLSFAWSRFLGRGALDQVLLDELTTLLAKESGPLDARVRLGMETDLLLMRGFFAMQQGALSVVEALANQVLQHCSAMGYQKHLPAWLLLASADLARGSLSIAETKYREIVEQAFANQYLITINAALAGTGRALTLQGKLREANDYLQLALQRLRQEGWDEYLPDTPWLYLCLSVIAYRRNDLALSIQHALAAQKLAKTDEWDALPLMIEVQLAELYLAQGEIDQSIAIIDAVDPSKIQPALLPFFPSVEEALLGIYQRLERYTQSDMGTKINRLLNIIIPNYDTHQPCYESRYKWLFVIRRYAALQQTARAGELAVVLLSYADRDENIEFRIQVHLLASLCYYRQNLSQQAIIHMEHALAISLAGGYLQFFADEGADVLAVLELMLSQSPADATRILSLLQALKRIGDAISIKQHAVIGNRIGTARTEKFALAQLTSKEMKTFRLLVQGLSNRQIADQLFVSNNTVKTHIKNIYSKLGISNREQAKQVLQQSNRD